jgi:CBS domain-containing protein
MNLNELLRLSVQKIFPYPNVEVANWTEVIIYAIQLGLTLLLLFLLASYQKMVINDTDQCDMNMVSKNLNAHDLMSPQVIVAKENTNAEQISARLLAGEFNGVPVVDDKGAVIGIVTALDILRALQGDKKLNTMLARDIMTPNPSTVKKDTPIEEIIRIIVEKEIVLVPVVEDNKKLIGVVARLDILREKLNEGFITIEKREAVSRT